MVEPKKGVGTLWQDGVCLIPGALTVGWPAPADIPLPPIPSFRGRFSTPERERAVWHLLACSQKAKAWVYVAWPRLVADILRLTNERQYVRELKSGVLLQRFVQEPQMPVEGQTLQMFRLNAWGVEETYAVAHGIRELSQAQPPCVLHTHGFFHEHTVDAYGLTEFIVDILHRKSVRPVSSS